MHIVVIVHCESQLLEIVLALRPPGRFAGLLNCGEQQGDENGDNGNHHQ